MSTDWTFGLFDCFGDCNACCYASCCNPCASGEIYEKTGLGSWGSGFCLACIPGLQFARSCIFTGPVRNKYGIDGDCCSDCLSLACCTPCHVTRTLREVREQEN